VNNSIFISYSRQNEKQAMHLLSVLRREGYTVWIDQESIAGASIWSDEIVQNIKSCDIFIALISTSSAESHNVSKEIALAAENKKIILPIEIGHVDLPGQLEYALAGIQRTSYSDEEAILHAVKNQLARLASEPTAHTVHTSPHRRKQILRRRITIGLCGILIICGGLYFLFRGTSEAKTMSQNVVVLPFSTLNLEQDSTRNLDIFSDAIQSKLSGIKLLSLVSSNVTMGYKNSSLNALAIGEELNARFIVEGTVRKSHNLNFVCVRIFDRKRGGPIWEGLFKGNSKELFTIKESVSNEVYGNLAGIVSEENEIQTVEQKIAANPKDVKLISWLGVRLIGTDKVRSLELLKRAIELDSMNISYVIYAGIVGTRQNDRGVSRDYGEKAVVLSRKLMKMYPDSEELVTNYALALDMAERNTDAEHIFDSLLQIKPKDIRLLYNAACCYAKQAKTDKALDLLDRLFIIAPGKRNEVISDPDFDNIRLSPRYIKEFASTS
jgi:TolB-like protein